MQTLGTQSLCLFPKVTKQWGGKARLCQSKSLPPPHTACQGMADLCRPGRKSLGGLLTLCVYLHCLFAWCYAVEQDEFKSRPWLLPLFVKHCYLEQAGIQRAAWVLRHLEQDQAGWIEGKAILADMDEGSSPTCYVLYWHLCSFLHLLYFILYSGKFKVVIIKWSFLKVSLTPIPTIIIPQQSFMSDRFPFPTLLMKLSVSQYTVRIATFLHTNPI